LLYTCEAGFIVPVMPATVGYSSVQSAHSTLLVTASPRLSALTSLGLSSEIVSSVGTIAATISPYSSVSLPDVEGRTGFSACTIRSSAARREDGIGIATYTVGGRMASVYDASEGAAFRCEDVPYPTDGFYVAFWTQWSSDDRCSSQPAPINCGDRLTFRNPLSNITANAIVLDRCASCVGVERQPNDPTLDLTRVNGATVDLSRALWNHLFAGSDGSVYDVEYDTKTAYPGWTDEPTQLAQNAEIDCKAGVIPTC